MRRSVRLYGSRGLGFACLGLIIAAGATLPAQQQIVPGTNVNMVSGTKFPDGDPYLQRQNEPSSAVSTRNPLHILGGANDYRTVDIPNSVDTLRTHLMNSDAWLGLFKSLDGGQKWTSTLLPGYPQDPTRAAPLWGYEAATDPVIKAGTNGMFYYGGLVFNRGENAPSAIFVARFMDMNNLEAGDPVVHLDTRIVDSDAGTRFLDKTALATDIPRTAATCTLSVPRGDGTSTSQIIPAGNVYVAYSGFSGTGAAEQSVILFSRSTNCGTSWSAPKPLSTGSRLVQNAQIAVDPATGYVYVSWRRFKYLSQDDAVMVIRSTDGGATFGKPVRVSGVAPFDQPTKETSFRSNGFQTMTVDATGRVYMAWTERGHATLRPSPIDGDARIVLSTSTNGTTWTVPRAIQPGGLGHQLMPALTFHAGRLRLLYYDLREDVSQIFSEFVDELNIAQANSPVRHTMDVFLAQASPGAAPTFTSARLSDYAFGFFPDSPAPLRLQYNPPNLPLFKQGTTPFMGDYIDLAPAPAFVQNANGSWSHNTAPSTAATSHAFWTDNRDVRAPADGRWDLYTPPQSPELGPKSRYDPNIDIGINSCSPTHEGMRNQNIYTARVTEGLFVSAPGNNKPLGTLQRAFVVVAENATAAIRSFRLTIANQPVGGQASFLQFSALTTLDLTVPPFSSVARSVFASSSNERARISVNIAEITAPGGLIVAGGLAGAVVLNADPDPLAPRLENPRLENPRLENPLIQNAEAYNAGITNAVFAVPRLENPRLENPTIENPRLENDSLGNPRLENDSVANPGVVSTTPTAPRLENPRLENPRLENPRLENQTLDDAGFSDSSWVLTNNGNTTAAYTINLVLNQAIPTGFTSQLLIHKTTTTPASINCKLAEQLHTVLIANVPNPQFVPFSEVANPRLENPRLENPTLALAPGESATITLRIVDPNRFDEVSYDASGAVTPAAAAQSVNTEDVAAGITTPRVAVPLTITTTALVSAQPGAAYTRSLQTLASIGTLTCNVISGTLPPGVALSSDGTISGTPTTPGNYRFTVRCVDANGSADDQSLFLQVDPTVPAGFDAAWNGADTDWSNPDNWSPRGVPLATDRVYVPVSIPVVPKLTRNVTIRDLVVEPGARVDTNGFTLTITHNADAGRTIVGNGTTVLTGDGVATGVFSNLEIRGRITLNGSVTVTGRLTLGAGARLSLNGQSLIVGGQLATNITAGATPPVVSGPATSFIVAGVLVNGLVLENAPLTIDSSTGEAALSQFDNVRFGAFAPEAVQLTVNHPGLPTHFAIAGATFSTTPTTGRLLQVNDTNDGANTLIIDVVRAVPADGTAATSTNGGAVVNWIFDPGDANLAVVQSVSPIPALAGTRLTYTITVSNGGPAAAIGVTLNPGIPAGATGLTSSSTQGTCVAASGGLTCNLGTLPAGSQAVVGVSFIPAGTGTLVTTATVSAAGQDSSQGNNTHTIAATIVAAGAGVNLTLAKTGSAASVAIGAPFTYGLTVTNAGLTTATSVIVTDPIPAGLNISTATASLGACSIAAGQVVCSLGTLSPGQAVTITLSANATVAGLVTNAASVTSDGLELTPADNVAVVQTMVLATAACSVPTFTGPVSYQGSPGPTAVVRLVDMDHDGDLDAVATHEIGGGGGGVDVFLNDGAGHFAAPRFTSTVTGPWVHVVADFNGDTHPDVISSSDGTNGNPPTLRLLTNDGTGALTLVPGFSVPFGGWLEAVDIDRDGDPDVVFVTPEDNVALLRNDGAAGFAAPVTLIFGAGGFFGLGDYNGDNRTDMIVPLGAAGFGVVLADAAGGFLAPIVHAVPGGVNSGSAADLNGDGHLDLLLIAGDQEEPSGQTRVVLGDGAGGFGAPIEVAVGSFVYFPTLTDVNGDGKIDLVAINGLDSFEVRLGDGAGGFGAGVQFPNANGYGPAVGDVNGDGRPDLVSPDRSAQINVFVNNCGAPAASLGVAVSESADPVDEGDELTYTVTLTNHAGTAATGVRLRSVLGPLTDDNPEAPSVTVVSTTSSANGATLTTAGTVYTWTIPTVAANSTATFQFRFRALGGDLIFVSGVTSDGSEADPFDNGAFETTTVVSTGRTITVTNTNDSGPGSLRQALLESNLDGNDVDHIAFNIGTGGPRTITVLSALPDIETPAIIDGTTQPGFSGAPIIELNGNGLAAANGLFISGGNTTVRGLVINRFGQNGIALLKGGGNVIEGNYIGVDLAGSAARPNVVNGVLVFSANNRIGGPAAAQRNVISGNSQAGVFIGNATATGNVVEGNYVGLNAAGTAAVPNLGFEGIAINAASGNSIRSNVVSGNASHGIQVFGPTSSANVVQGNFIGTDPTGTNRIANAFVGLQVWGAVNTVIGGPGTARNIISGNGTGIELRTGATGTRVENNYIGINAAGTAAIANGNGININDAANSNTIGGTAAGVGNVISGNTTAGVTVRLNARFNLIQGNLIGTNAAGNAAVPNNPGLSIDAGTTTIGGTVTGARNLISGNNGYGVVVTANAVESVVQGNFIGTNLTGTGAVPNTLSGVNLTNALGVTVGGTAAGAGNVISGNLGNGIFVAGSAGDLVQGNFIGTTANGTTALPNSAHGIAIGSSDGITIGGTQVGAANIIRNNGGAGVTVTGATARNNSIQGNSISGNAGLGIDLNANGVTANDAGDADDGPNHLQNFPLLSAGSGGAGGTLTSTPNTAFRVEFFGNTTCDGSGSGEGATFLGAQTVTTDVGGNATIAPFGTAATVVTATATDPTGNTSEFSPCVIVAGGPQTIVVTNTNDSGAGSLREAIATSNATAGIRDTIAFNIPGSGPHSIALASALPAVSDPVVIDATTEPDYAGTPVVELNGAGAGTANGLQIVAGNTAVRGLAINRFGGTGIVISGNGANVISGNYIGTDITGAAARPNTNGGIQITSSGNTIGGTTAALRNVISGNQALGVGIQGGTGNTVQGNYIGVDAGGTAALSNGAFGISLFGTQSNLIGGTTPGTGNVVSASTSINISLQGAADNNVVQGNFVGLNAAGTAAVGANQNGLYLIGSSNNLLGGITVGARNVVAGGVGSGEIVLGTGSSNNSVQGNFIGTNAAGTAALPNTTWGIQISSASNNSIGGAVAGAGNLISGNSAGGIVFFGTSTGNTVSGNRIGTAADGVSPLPNQSYGVGLIALGNTIGDTAAPNTIAFNTGAGVQVFSGTGTRITTNLVFSNGGLGIDLATLGVTTNDQDDVDAGPNGAQNYPVLTRAVLSATQFDLDVTFNSVAGRAYTIEYFRSTTCDPSGFGEGAQPAGVSTLGAIGNSTVQFTAAMGPAGFAVGQFITATATSIDGTSEFSACIQVAAPAPTPQTFVVLNTSDSGLGSLRQAILDANATASTRDTIAFNIPGTGAHTISPLSILPTLTGPVVIDASTQPGFAGSPLIELDGTNAGGNANGLWLASSGSVIRGFAINRFGTGGTGSGGGGIVLQGGGNHVVEGNFVGTDVTGTIARPNRVDGIWIDSPSNRIGGTAVSARNVISGNGRNGIELVGAGATGNTVQGNYIGLDRDGVADLGNTGLGIEVFSAPSNIIGGTTAAARNIISGNNSNGLTISGSTATTNIVQGNYVGTDATGTARVGNSFEGIVLFASNNTIGGTAHGAGNVIAANRFGLWVNSGDNNVIQGNFVGTNAASAPALGNVSTGMLVFGTGNIVGGTTPGAGNVIVANGADGLRIAGAGSVGEIVQGNFIGTDAAGVTGLGNAGPGIAIFNGATNHTIGGTAAGAGNVIARNAGAGVSITDPATGGNAIRANSIFSNSGLGIDLHTAGVTANDPADADTGANRLQNFPVLTSAVTDGSSTTISGTLNSVPNATFRIEFFTSTACDPSGNGEGETFIGSTTVTTDSTGNVSIPFVASQGGQAITATATSPTNDTSEFSNCIQAQTTFGAVQLALADATVVGVGRTAALQVTLPSAAPAGGVTVTVASGNASVLSIGLPRTVSFAPGETLGRIAVSGVAAGTVTVTATASNYTDGTLDVVVTENLISTPVNLTVAFGQSTALPVNIGPSPAPPGGLTLAVASNDSSTIEVITPVISVPAGAFSANATVRGVRIGAANVTVSNPAFSPSATHVVSTAELNILQSSSSFNDGLPAPTLTIRLESGGSATAAQPALTVALTSANPACVTAPASVTIPSGLVSTTFTPAYGGSATLPCTTTITASATNLVTDVVSITVNPRAEIASSGPVTVGAGLIVSGFASLGTSAHGGAQVTISSSDSSRVQLSKDTGTAGAAAITLTVPDGQSFVQYVLQGVENMTGSATVTLSASGFTGTSHQTTVVAPGVEIAALDPTTSTLSLDDTDWYAQVGIPNNDGTGLAQVQVVRFGAPLILTFTNSNPTVGRLRSDEPAVVGQTVTKPIQPGVYYTRAIASGTSWGLGFEPLANGSTSVTVSGPGNIRTMTTTGVRAVEVSGASIATQAPLVIVGGGLMVSTAAQLSAAGHGGVELTISSSDATKVRVSSDSTTIGTASITVSVPNNTTFVPYVLQGIETTTDDVTITISAAGFGEASHQVKVVPAGVEIAQLDATTSPLAGEDKDWYVQVGIPSPGGAQLSQIQLVRPGSPLIVTLTNSNDAVARLRSDQPPATGQIVTKPIQPGSFFTVAAAEGTSWGLAFEPLANGTTTVTVSGPAGVQTMSTSGVREVTVSNAGINPSAAILVGSRLMTFAFGFLTAANHGGIDVTVTSSDSTKVRLSADGQTAGTASVKIPVPNGQSFFSYFVLGVPNATGTTSVTLSADGFGEASHQVEVVPAGVEIAGLDAEMSNLSADDTDWYVQVGIPNSAGSSLFQIQLVQPGPPLEVTLTNSQSTVGRLHSDEPVATGQSVTKPIQPGAYFTLAALPGSLYGLGFEPLANGTTTVTAGGPLGVQTMTTTGVASVQITTPRIIVPTAETVGAGLQLPISGSLNGSQHGGINVLISSSAPDVVRVSPEATTAGTASFSYTVANNQTAIPFFVQGMENVTGTAVVTLSAPGFTTATLTVTVVPSGIEIQGLLNETSVTAPEQASWYVATGIPNAARSALSIVQPVRGGSPGFIVTLSTSNGLARLRSDQPVGAGQTVTKPVAPGNYYTLAVGLDTTFGLGFQALAAGDVVVAASGPPGVIATAAASVPIIIHP